MGQGRLQRKENPAPPRSALGTALMLSADGERSDAAGGRDDGQEEEEGILVNYYLAQWRLRPDPLDCAPPLLLLREYPGGLSSLAESELAAYSRLLKPLEGFNQTAPPPSPRAGRTHMSPPSSPPPCAWSEEPPLAPLLGQAGRLLHAHVV